MPELGRYQIEAERARHGFWVNYLAFDPKMNRKVFLLAAEENAGEEARAALLHQARVLSRLDHPNILRLLDCGEDERKMPFLALEHFEGAPLGENLRADRLAAIVDQAAAALDHAHAKGVIHRNVCPANVLVDDAGEVKLTGFEVAVESDAKEEAAHATEVFSASIAYLAPELLLGDDTAAGSDQFSIAAMAYRSLTGASPFAAERPVSHVFEIVFGAAGLDALDQSFPAGARRVFERALAKNAGERYGSCGDFAKALEGSLVRKAQVETRAVPVQFREDLRPQPAPRRKIPLAWIAAAAAVVSGLAGWAYVSLRHPTPAQVAPAQDSFRDAAKKIAGDSASPTPVPAPAKRTEAVKRRKIEPVKETKEDKPKLAEPKTLHP